MNSSQPLFRDAVKATQTVNSLFEGRPASLDAFQRMTQHLLDTRRRFVLYLGAGCSKQVHVEQTAGAPKHVGKDWIELLDALLCDQNKQKNFFNVLRERSGLDFTGQKITEALKYSDKLTIAWLLTCQFLSKKERDRAIALIVEPPVNAPRSCPLLEELSKFPFKDVITTNYDSNITHFFNGHRKTPLPEITCTEDLFKVLDGTDGPRLFYLHGKAGQSRLVFDRFDYQQLLAERDGILDYVTFLLRNSHVVYVGFGLDDPSFNLMETRLNTYFDVQDRPESFALLQHVSEIERKAWGLRRLRLIDYGDHDALAVLFQCLNKVCAFIGYAEPDRPRDADPLRDRTGAYIKKAAQHYVSGDFKKSIEAYRAALASTLFWERDKDGDFLKPSQAQLVCNIFIQLAQSHYKLRWTHRSEIDEEDHAVRMDGNLSDAGTILSQKNSEAFSEHGRVALENSIKVLTGRIRYHSGKYSDARAIYSTIIEQTKPYLMQMELDKIVDPWMLKIAEASYYSQCQISRIDYQVRPSDCLWRTEQIAVLQDVQQKIRDISQRILDSKTGFDNDGERDNSLRNFATILRIAQWTEGRLTIACFRDLLPVKAERSPRAIEELSRGISLLQSDPWPQLSESVPSLGKRGTWGAPARWLAMRYRYEARGHALKWIVKTEAGVSQDASDLIAAYACMQNAMGQTAGRNLERQSVLNILEALRLSILVMFGERVIPGPRVRGIRSTPFSRAMGLHYLYEAFDMIRTIKTPSDDGWHRVLAHRLASYFSLVARPFQDDELNAIGNDTLRAFLRESPEKIKEAVVSQYVQFADDSNEHDLLDVRIDAYKQTFDFVQKEIEGLALGTSA
jgi:hypothetical protein